MRASDSGIDSTSPSTSTIAVSISVVVMPPSSAGRLFQTNPKSTGELMPSPWQDRD